MANLNLNKVILGGRLTQNPELRQTPSGVMVLRFTVAVNRRFGTKNEDGTRNQPEADFINCVAWNQQAEFISRYFHKGSCICIVGNIRTGSFTDQQGNKRYTTEVFVDEANFVDAKGENQGGFDQGYSQQGQGSYMPSSYNSAPQPQYSTPAGQNGAPAAQNSAAPQFELIDAEDELPF